MSNGFRENALAYLLSHAIKPEIAADVGVRQVGNEIHYPYASNGASYVRRRPLGSSRTIQPGGRELDVWWPRGRPPGASVVLVCEGEPDALAALSAIPGDTPGAVVAAIPGTGFPPEKLAEELHAAGVQKAYLVFDADKAGEIATDKVCITLTEQGVEAFVIDLPEGLDLADCLAAEEDGAKWLVTALQGAEAFVSSAGMNGAAPQDASGSSLTSFEDIVARPVRWTWQDRIAQGKTTALAGRPKIGKGLLYSDLTAQVTRGTLDGDLTGPRDVIVVTTEDDPGDTLKPRLMVADADLSRVSIFQMGTKDDPVPFRVPQDATELSRRVKEKNAALVVIDPLLEFVDGKLDSHKSQPVRQALAAVNQIARENSCAVLTIFHLNKGISTDPLLRHEASAAFTQVVRGGMLLGHDPDDADGEDGRQRVLAVSSSNLAAIAPSLVYEISTARVMGDTGEEIVTARIACTGESTAGAHDLLRGRADEEEQTGTDEAEEFLTAELAGGQRPADEMIKAARRLGISDKQLRRARSRLKVESEKGGFKEGWNWSLPKAPSAKAPSLPSNSGAPSTPSPFQAENQPPEDTKAPLHGTGTSSGQKTAQPACNCPEPRVDDADDSRCTRCYGWPGASA